MFIWQIEIFSLTVSKSEIGNSTWRLMLLLSVLFCHVSSLCCSVVPPPALCGGSHAAAAAELHSDSQLSTPPQLRTGCIALVSEDFWCTGCSKTSASILSRQTTLPFHWPWICLTDITHTHTHTHRHTRTDKDTHTHTHTRTQTLTHRGITFYWFLQRGFYNPLVVLRLTELPTCTNKQPFEIHYPL